MPSGYLKNGIAIRKGAKLSEATKKKLREANMEEKGTNWKGNDVGYRGIHNWINRKLGKPTKCSHCDKDGLTGRKIGWANKDHKYKRNLTDWIRLCEKCHKAYDRDILGIKVGR